MENDRRITDGQYQQNYQQPQQPMQNYQPYQPQQTYQPQQPMQPMHPQHVAQTQDTNDLQKVAVVLDKHSMRIIKEAGEVFAETIVNLGIKLFSETDTYRNYMLKEEYKTEVKESRVSSNTTNQSSQQASPQQEVPSIQQTAQFTSW
ncbi:MAG: hypothetical protein WC136_00475 [Sphaerochaeta sp.]|jgi:hypothetical protein